MYEYKRCIIKNDDNYKDTKVIMITAKKMEDDVLEGFKCGAVDYITKPFSNKILLARIKAHLESLNSIGGIKNYKDIIVDTDKMIVKVQDKEVELTNFEYKRVDKARSRQTGGTGLGLAIVKHITQLHKGSVSVESKVGKGSTFKIILPE